AAIGLGVYVDSLTLGPRGFFFVLILIGPGAWAIALACAAGVVAFLSQGSIVTKIMLWALEIALCLFTHSLVIPLLGGLGCFAEIHGRRPHGRRTGRWTRAANWSGRMDALTRRGLVNAVVRPAYSEGCMHPVEAGLLSAICAEADADGPRLVYAD